MTHKKSLNATTPTNIKKQSSKVIAKVTHPILDKETTARLPTDHHLSYHANHSNKRSRRIAQKMPNNMNLMTAQAIAKGNQLANTRNTTHVVQGALA